MIQLQILTGKQAGAHWVARRFPVRIGRAATAELAVEEDGVWDQHARLDFEPAEGVVLSVQPGALASVNGERVERATLRNGDMIQLGALALQFWLSPTRQAGFRAREWLTWAGIAAVCLAQVALVYWLLP